MFPIKLPIRPKNIVIAPANTLKINIYLESETVTKKYLKYSRTWLSEILRDGLFGRTYVIFTYQGFTMRTNY